MSGQINSAVSAVVGRADFAQAHHPHALVTHDCPATVVRVLQRTGEMNYPGQFTVETLGRIVIGSQWDLVALRLACCFDSDKLDRAAEQIVRQTAPFLPFPAELEERTAPLEPITHVRLKGGNNLVPK